MLLTEQIEGERWSRKAPRVGDDAPTGLTSATLSGEARRGSGGANGDAPPSRSARGFESMQEAPEAGVEIDLAKTIASPQASSPTTLERGGSVERGADSGCGRCEGTATSRGP